MWHKNIAGRFFGLVTKHACDGQTDRQNYISQDRASIASRGKNINAEQATEKKLLTKHYLLMIKYDSRIY